MSRRFLTLLLVLAVLVPSSAAAQAVCGDVNESGSVNTTDALLVLKTAVGQPVDLTCPPTGGIQQTGQTVCYDGLGAEIDCEGTGQDGDFQLGASRSFTDNGDGTITDDVTGLVWEKMTDDGSIHDKDSTWTWENAFTSKIEMLNLEVFAGYEDWRLPNRFELDSLVNLGASGPAAYSVFAAGCTNGCTSCSCTRPDYYWTSSTYVANAAYGWTVYFNAGDTYASKKDQAYFVRAVRGGH